MKSLLYASVLLATLLSCSKSKQEQLQGEWKVAEMDLSGNKVKADLFNISYEFGEDNSFSRTENGKTEKGTYKISAEGDSLMLTYSSTSTTQGRKIQELSSDSLITTWEEFGMKTTEVARSVQK